MQNFRYYLRLVSAFLVKFRLFIILSIILGISTFFVFNYMAKFIAPQNEIIGLVGRYHSDTLPQEVLQEISLGLTKIGENKQPLPAIAREWYSDNQGKTWTFKINKDLKWQDGTAVTSQNIVYEFSDVKTTTPDDETIIFNIENSFSPFPSIVSKPVYKKGLIGVGDYKVEKITFSSQYVKEIVLKNKNGKKKTYRFFPTTESLKTAFKLGKIDIIDDLLDPEPFDDWSTASVKKRVEKNQVVTLFFNTKSQFLSEKEVRQALFYAIDKNSLGERAYSPIQPNSWAYNPQVKSYEYDIEKAKKMLSDILKDDKSVKINLVSSPSLISIAQKIVDDWKKIGIETTLLISSIIPTEYDAFLTIYDIPPDPDQYSLWHTTQISTNISKYSNPRIDKLLEDGRSVIDMEERKKIYIDFQRFLLEDLPAGFIVHPVYYTVTRK